MTGSSVEVDNIPETAAATETSNAPEAPFTSGYVTYEKDLPAVESAPPAKKPPLALVVAILVFGLAAAAGVSMFMTKKSSPAVPTFQNLGAGISNATGLRGSLQVRWESSAQYQVKFEPIDPLQSDGFSFVAANPQPPMTINMRLLDATGFALCSKVVAFPSDGAKSGSADVFQNTTGADGKVTAFSAQGLLPCTADQFRQASYWDFTTNFPTLPEQEAMLKQTANAKALKEAQARAAQRRNSGMGFTAEGYDGASGYDSSRNTLETRLGRNFLVTRASDRTAANTWATTASLFHYKCDQRSRCTLTHAGGGQTIFVMAMQ